MRTIKQEVIWRTKKITSDSRTISWPTPDDPEWADSGKQTIDWLKATQPEALARRLGETVSEAFQALSNLAMFSGSYPQAALINALAELPADRAATFKEQLDFASGYAQDRHSNRGTNDSLEDRLFELAMMNSQPEQD